MGSKILYMTQPTGVWSLLMSFCWSTKREVILLEVQESLRGNHIPWRFKVNMKQTNIENTTSIQIEYSPENQHVQ